MLDIFMLHWLDCFPTGEHILINMSAFFLSSLLHRTHPCRLIKHNFAGGPEAQHYNREGKMTHYSGKQVYLVLFQHMMSYCGPFQPYSYMILWHLPPRSPCPHMLCLDYASKQPQRSHQWYPCNEDGENLKHREWTCILCCESNPHTVLCADMAAVFPLLCINGITWASFSQPNLFSIEYYYLTVIIRAFALYTITICRPK